MDFCEISKVGSRSTGWSSTYLISSGFSCSIVGIFDIFVGVGCVIRAVDCVDLIGLLNGIIAPLVSGTRAVTIGVATGVDTGVASAVGRGISLVFTPVKLGHIKQLKAAFQVVSLY